MTADPIPPTPDDKDWTWVLSEPCPECGFDARAISPGDVPGIVRSTIASFRSALAAPDANVRPAPDVWSPLEYGCHVRDVFDLFAERLRLMLTEDDPMFANWDQDVTALEQRYWSQDPATVSVELAATGDRIAAAFEAVRDDQWQRPSRRSNGSTFTVDTFARYFAHDLVHHTHDIST